MTEEDHIYEGRPSRLNSDNISLSTDSVPINLGHISCEMSKECSELSKEDMKDNEIYTPSGRTKECKDGTSGHLSGSSSSQTASKEYGIKSEDGFSNITTGSSSHNSIDNQSHNAFPSHSNDKLDVIQSRPPDPVVSQCIDANSRQLSTTTIGLSDDSLRTPLITCVEPHSGFNSVDSASHDYIHAQSQTCSKNEGQSSKTADRKRIIDEVYKTCAECENRKVHERSEFSSEARLAQTNHTEYCKCGNASKRRKRDSSGSLGSRDDVKCQRTVSPSTDLQKDIIPEAPKHSGPTEKLSEVEIQGSLPASDKASVLERFDHEGRFSGFLFELLSCFFKIYNQCARNLFFEFLKYVKFRIFLYVYSLPSIF